MIKNVYFNSFKIGMLTFIMLVCINCNHNSPTKNYLSGQEDKKGTLQNTFTSAIEIMSPVIGSHFTIGDILTLYVKRTDTVSPAPDSIQVYINGKNYKTLFDVSHTVEINTLTYKAGYLDITCTVFKNGQTDQKQTYCYLYSDIIPGELKYKVINTYHHDESAFTQGLIYDNGYLIESTGQHGKSTVRKVEIKSGEVLKIHRLDNSFFGEGITLLHKRIYQITWKSQTAFIYDKEDFSLLQKINYRSREGWGLTHNGHHFIMSNGTSNLYLLDTVLFTEVGKIEVYDNNGAVGRLNELEYINGKIYANIFASDRIVVIDPSSGKVENYIDCKNLVPAELKGKNTDKVLNGIAFNPENKHVYVTGKKWPVLYEIKLF